MLVALMMSVLLGFVALALDSGRALDARRTLQDSVDAAAVSAADRYYTALNATPAQTAAVNWSQAEQKGIQVFARNQRVNQSASCSNGYPVPTVSAPATTSCTLVGGAISLILTVSDTGPGGQVFAYAAQTSLTVALMQVLGQNPILTMQAAAAATSGDQAATPALAGLSPAGCFNNIGTDPIHIQSSTNYLTVNGDVVSAGDLNMGGLSYLQVAGNVLTRCNNLIYGDHISYRCWPSYTAAPCSAPNVLGQLASTTYHFPDPVYQAPSATFLSALTTRNLALTVNQAVQQPGAYAAATTFNDCYFLAAGLYDWQSGYTVSGGLISNELKPPDEPDLTDLTGKARSLAQFWDDYYNGTTPNGSGTTSHLHCDGSFAVSQADVQAGHPGLAQGTYGVVVSSTRTDSVALPYAGLGAPVSTSRESAPSRCQQVVVNKGGEGIQVTVSNVPGAQGYNVYATALNGSCTGPFGFVGSVTNAAAELNDNTGAAGHTSAGGLCPDISATPNCSLGQAFTPPGSPIDGLVIGPGFTPVAGLTVPAIGAYPGRSQNAPYVNPNGPASIPAQQLANQVPPRATGGAALNTGDQANENACAAANGSSITCPSYLTRGAVQMYVPSGCLTINNTGDEYLFSGYQYNWVLHYVATPGQACTNIFRGYANTAPIGMSYAPNTTWSISYTRAFGAPYTGGIVAWAVSVTVAAYLVLDFNAAYAPYPPGSRLTG